LSFTRTASSARSCEAIGTEFVAENEKAVAFHDLHPQAPIHVLVVSRAHLENVSELVETDKSLALDLISLAVEVARIQGIEESGFRILTNTGRDADQSVQHLHFHVLGGAKLGKGLA
jgi:histidine triad (HIT) family protein